METNYNLNFWLYVLLLCLCYRLPFVGKNKHLLNVLLSLEFIMLNIMVNIFLVYGSGFWAFSEDLYFVLFFLILAVCEGALLFVGMGMMILETNLLSC